MRYSQAAFGWKENSVLDYHAFPSREQLPNQGGKTGHSFHLQFGFLKKKFTLKQYSHMLYVVRDFSVGVIVLCVHTGCEVMFFEHDFILSNREQNSVLVLCKKKSCGYLHPIVYCAGNMPACDRRTCAVFLFPDSA